MDPSSAFISDAELSHVCKGLWNLLKKGVAMELIRKFLMDHLCGSLPSNPHTFLAVCLVACWGMQLPSASKPTGKLQGNRQNLKTGDIFQAVWYFDHICKCWKSSVITLAEICLWNALYRKMKQNEIHVLPLGVRKIIIRDNCHVQVAHKSFQLEHVKTTAIMYFIFYYLTFFPCSPSSSSFTGRKI